MRRFGSRVTVIERNPACSIARTRTSRERLHELFEDEGIEGVTNAHVYPRRRKVRAGGESPREPDGSEMVLEGTHLLVATGRTPNTDGIGLELAGVETTDRGYVKVNERLETTAPGVWAAGDCAGSPHFTHISR